MFNTPVWSSASGSMVSRRPFTWGVFVPKSWCFHHPIGSWHGWHGWNSWFSKANRPGLGINKGNMEYVPNRNRNSSSKDSVWKIQLDTELTSDNGHTSEMVEGIVHVSKHSVSQIRASHNTSTNFSKTSANFLISRAIFGWFGGICKQSTAVLAVLFLLISSVAEVLIVRTRGCHLFRF